jgi:hypothetical protein
MTMSASSVVRRGGSDKIARIVVVSLVGVQEINACAIVIGVVRLYTLSSYVGGASIHEVNNCGDEAWRV